MTKLSDALRGVVDRAPVDDIHVSTTATAGRVRRQRAARVGANALAGTGAAAIIGLAVLNPMAGSNDSAAADAAPEMADSGRDMAAAEDFAGSSTMLAWGVCGTFPFEGDVPNQAVGSALLVNGIGDDYAGGDTITAEAMLDTDLSGNFETFGVQGMVLWNGMVVGFGTSEVAEATTVTLPDAAGEAQPVAADLVNCWDGAALPAATYELVAVQELWALDTEEPVMPEPSLEPGDGPAESGPGEPVTGGEESVGDEPADTPDVDAVEPTIEPLPVEPGAGMAAGGQMWRVVSGPVAFTVAGDPVDDPFAEYLPQPAQPTELPEGYLDPETARAEYEAHVTDEPWDMAKGTSRVLLMRDSAQMDSSEDLWTERYFGCPWDGAPAPQFPSGSADWDLLDVRAQLPSSISLSYGWVVDGNPQVSSAVTNTSDYTLPGYFQDPASSLILVKDGRVVAEAWLQQQDRDAAFTETGALEQGATLSADLLWRELSGCWVGDRQTEVEPGTYTVLTVTGLYLDNYLYGDDVIAFDDEAAARSEGADAAYEESEPAMVEPDIAIDPYFGDYLELQVWSSLGEVTIS